MAVDIYSLDTNKNFEITVGDLTSFIKNSLIANIPNTQVNDLFGNVTAALNRGDDWAHGKLKASTGNSTIDTIINLAYNTTNALFGDVYGSIIKGATPVFPQIEKKEFLEKTLDKLWEQLNIASNMPLFLLPRLFNADEITSKIIEAITEALKSAEDGLNEKGLMIAGGNATLQFKLELPAIGYVENTISFNIAPNISKK